MGEIKASLNSFRVIELFIATLLGSVAGRVFAIYRTLPDLESRIAWSIMIVFSFLGFATFFYFVAWLFDSYAPPRLRRSKKQEAKSEETEEETCDSLKLRDEFRHRKI